MKLLPIRKKPQDKPGQNSKPNSKDRTGDNLREALSRCGLFPPRNWHEIANKLSKHDDVVLGLDTNVLRNAFVTAQLLPSLSLVEPKKYVHTPNWILLVVPGTTMFELEEAANARTEGGQLNYTGRAGFRALQEILTLSENVDISGLSLLIAGEADPVLDAKSELKSISKGIEALNNNSRGHHSYKVYKSSSGDMTIRSQFKNMLRQLDFHKGAYFITADKTNAALALAEGLQPIFVGSPEYPRLNQEICLEEQSPIQQFSLGKLLYELAVAFGDFRITTKDKSFSFALEADKKGESLHNWLHKKLRIHNSDLNKLVNQYRGRFDLKKAVSLYQSLTKDFETVDWLAELTHAFEEEVEDFINEEEMI
ncbi:MAG TPA: hypothetical protein DCE41_15020 [Cytophagales bacterium]|nr:hypothetical protein [Cytophagales bacterium]HAA24300.1 hypothetical protein [Cytophagales bacterium]HAP59458.1 hypothetical protein [Cytophagales bacterium]